MRITVIVVFGLLFSNCTPLPPTKVVLVLTDSRSIVACNETQPVFSEVGSTAPISLVLDSKSDADTCVWRGTVDIESPGQTKMFAVAIQFFGTEFGDTVVNIDTTSLEHTTGGVLYDLTLSSYYNATEGTKRIPLYSRRTSSWDTLYFSMNNYSH